MKYLNQNSVIEEDYELLELQEEEIEGQ